MPATESRRAAFNFFCLANITTSFNVSALSAAIPSISKTLGFSAVDTANIFPFYMIPYAVGALVFAPLARKFSVRSLMTVSMIAYALANGICADTDSLTWMLAARVIMGLAASGIIPLGLMMMGSLYPKESRGRKLGLFFSATFFGAAAGLLVSGFAPWRWLFVLPAAAALGIVLGLCILPPEALTRLEGKQPRYLRVLGEPGVLKIFGCIFFIGMLFNGVAKWYGVYLDEVYHLSQWQISFFILLTAVVSMAGQNLGGILSDFKGRTFACFWGIVILGAGTMLLYRLWPLWLLAGILAFISIGWTVGHNGITTVLADFPDESRAEIASLNSSIRFLSGGLGFYFSGAFVEKNFALTFLVIGFLMLLSAYFVPKLVVE